MGSSMILTNGSTGLLGNKVTDLLCLGRCTWRSGILSSTPVFRRVFTLPEQSKNRRLRVSMITALGELTNLETSSEIFRQCPESLSNHRFVLQTAWLVVLKTGWRCLRRPTDALFASKIGFWNVWNFRHVFKGSGNWFRAAFRQGA